MEDHELPARLEERIVAIQRDLRHMVTKQEFKPVQRVVYGMVGIILVYVVGNFMTEVVKAMSIFVG